MPHNPISVGMRVYALHLKQKSTAAGFDGILRKLRSAFLKRKQKRRSKGSDPLVLVYIGYIYGKYLVAIIQTIIKLRDDLPQVNECAIMPLVNNVTNST